MESGIFLVFLVLIIFIRIIAGSMDGDRIKDEIERKGGKLVSKEWNPFEDAWSGNNSNRSYDVKYTDKEGNLHKAVVRTSLFSGVFFGKEKVLKSKNESALKSENERLKKEIQRLKRRKT